MVKVRIKKERLLKSHIGKKPVKVIEYIVKDVSEEELQRLKKEGKVIEILNQ